VSVGAIHESRFEASEGGRSKGLKTRMERVVAMTWIPAPRLCEDRLRGNDMIECSPPRVDAGRLERVSPSPSSSSIKGEESVNGGAGEAPAGSPRVSLGPMFLLPPRVGDIGG